MTPRYTHQIHTEIVEDRRTDGIMVQRVLVPLDGSESAAEPGKRVAEVLSGFFAVGEVEFVLFDFAQRGRERASRTGVEEDAQSLREAGFIVRVVRASGDPAQSILTYVSEQGVDLVVIVSQCNASAAVRERVLRGVNVPVLIMRAAE